MVNQILDDKNIILAVTGGIAAYKSAYLASSLSQQGANVQPLLTESATNFIGSATFSALCDRPVRTDIFSGSEKNHVQLADWADLIVVVPATMNTMAKLANGLADNLITCACAASSQQTPILICPAMHEQMYQSSANQNNLQQLKQNGYLIMEPELGNLASGDEGQGRLPAPEQIEERIKQILEDKLLAGKQVLVTAGPTREAIDPVRFLTNHSTGKMGYELARAATRLGAEVTLISGPSTLNLPPDVNLCSVKTAKEMKRRVEQESKDKDLILMAAAVSDFRPQAAREEKLKKGGNDEIELNLVCNPDILQQLKTSREQVVVGFAAETTDLIDNAQRKLEAKDLDAIFANPIGKKTGFSSKTNQGVLITSSGLREKFQLQTKQELARKLLLSIRTNCLQTK